MMGLTHMAIATAGVSFAVGSASPAVLGLAVLGSQLPDIDSTESWIGQICFPVSQWLQRRYPHRTITHSFAATAAIALVTMPLYWLFGWTVWAALWLAHLITIFSDTFTKKGVQLFFPAPVWCVCGINPHRRLATGGPGEYWVLSVAVALLCLNLYLTSSGGFMTKVSQVLGMKEGAVRTYNEQAASHQLYAEVEGVWAGDRRSAQGRYPVIAAEGTEFIVLTPKGLVKTGEGIVTSKLAMAVGSPATTQTQTITFDDDELLPRLRAIVQQFPGAGMFLSGELAIDRPDDVRPSRDPNQLQTLTLSGSVVKLTYHPLDRAVLDLRDQYATGTVVIKVITPKPSL